MSRRTIAMKAGAAGEPRADKLPPEIYAGLVETLFGTVGSFISGIFGGLIVPIIAWFRTGQSVFFLCSGAIFVVALFRIGVFLAHRRTAPAARRAQASAWEAAYGLGGIGFMTAVGVTAAVMLGLHHDELTVLYGVVIAMSCAGAVAGRNAGRPKIVMGQILGLCGPLAIILLLKFDAWYWGLSFIMLLVIASVKSTTHFLNGMLVTALLSERESQRQRQQLSTALNSMTHGLCMTSADGSITVMNQRLRDFFASLASDPVDDLNELTSRIARHGGLSAPVTAAFARDIQLHVAQREPRTCTQAIGSRIYLFRCEPMENGGSVMVVEDVTEARRSAEQVERLAHYDTLTGLTNRFQFQKTLQSALTTLAAESGLGLPSLTLLSIDLDRFKEVNDTLGHPMGDKLLQQVAARLHRLVEPLDVVGRFGGDEFQILLPRSLAEGELDTLAGQIVSGISEPYLVEGHAISIGASLGIAVAPTDAKEADDLLKCADMALYSAKAASRGTFRHFKPEMDIAAQWKRRTEQELREALAAGHLEVHYQPTVDVRTLRVTTCEALVRWRHPTRGLVPPDQFIPIAEETGLIAEIGEFVLRRACEDARSWPDEIRVAVNVSAKQFLLRQDLVARIAAILEQTGFPTARLELEITESALLDAKESLMQLAGLGIRISLDDFGTGYSSLSYLRHFTVHKIKIDRSFVKIQDPVSLAIIDAVSFLAQSLGVELVVEGVEVEAQLRPLVERRIHLIQGYMFSKPRPIAELEPLLRGTFPPNGAVELRKVA